MWASTCKWVRTRLPLLAGGDLVGRERRCVERHLIGCPDCRRLLAAQRAALGALHTAAGVLGRTEAPGLWPELARQIRESRREAPLPWYGPLLGPAAALAASMMLVVVGALVARYVEDGHRAAPVQVASKTNRPASPRPDLENSAENHTEALEKTLADSGIDPRTGEPRLGGPYGADHATLVRPSVEDTR